MPKCHQEIVAVAIMYFRQSALQYTLVDCFDMRHHKVILKVPSTMNRQRRLHNVCGIVETGKDIDS